MAGTNFSGTSEHYGKAHGSLLSGWMNYNYTACCWFPTSSNILILPSQFWQIRFESRWLHCSKCRILVLLRYSSLHGMVRFGTLWTTSESGPLWHTSRLIPHEYCPALGALKRPSGAARYGTGTAHFRRALECTLSVISKWNQDTNHSPNIQTSLAEVKRLKLMDSGAIHLMGSLPLDASRWKGTLLFSLVS